MSMYRTFLCGLLVLAAGASSAPAATAGARLPRAALALDIFRLPITEQTRLTAAERTRLNGPGWTSYWDLIGGPLLSQARHLGTSNYIAIPGNRGMAVTIFSRVGDSRDSNPAPGFGPGSGVVGYYPNNRTTFMAGLGIGPETADFFYLPARGVESKVFYGKRYLTIGGAIYGTVPASVALGELGRGEQSRGPWRTIR
jgi:hypothetical protein